MPETTWDHSSVPWNTSREKLVHSKVSLMKMGQSNRTLGSCKLGAKNVNNFQQQHILFDYLAEYLYIKLKKKYP